MVLHLLVEVGELGTARLAEALSKENARALSVVLDGDVGGWCSSLWTPTSSP